MRTVIYAAPDLERAKAWYTALLGFGPYFDEPFYVGFNVAGYELGLDPNGRSPGPGGATAYWGVEDVDAAVERAVSLGARMISAVQAVGDDIRVATVADPAGNFVGLIENPSFQLPVAVAPVGTRVL